MRKLAPFLLLAILTAGAGWYAFTKKPDTVHELATPSAPAALPPRTIQRPEQASVDAEPIFELEPHNEPEAVVEPLPPPDQSEPQFDQSLIELLGSETVQHYVVQSDVISRMVPMLDSLSTRQVPPLLNPVKPVGGELIVELTGDQIILSPDNYARYDDYVQELQNVDNAELLSLYQLYQPLFQEAWVDNGNEGSFTRRMVEVIDELLATPDVPQPIYLTKPEAVYVFEDPILEEMPAGQKILVRMGSANAELVKLKLTEIRASLVGE